MNSKYFFPRFFHRVASISIINCSVYNRSVNKTLFPWKILSVDELGINVEQYYKRKVFQEIYRTSKIHPRSMNSSQHFLEEARIRWTELKYHVCVPDRPSVAPTMNAFYFDVQFSVAFTAWAPSKCNGAQQKMTAYTTISCQCLKRTMLPSLVVKSRQVDKPF